MLEHTVNGTDGEAQEPVTTDGTYRNASFQTRRDRLLEVTIRTDTSEMINEFTHNAFLLGFPYLFPLGIGEKDIMSTSISKRVMIVA